MCRSIRLSSSSAFVLGANGCRLRRIRRSSVAEPADTVLVLTALGAGIGYLAVGVIGRRCHRL